MRKTSGISLATIALIIGFMIAVQYQTVKNPIERDTRDLWELRADLRKEQQMQSNFLKEIRKYDETLKTYEAERENSKEAALNDTLQELKKRAGLTQVTGPGVMITIEPLFEENLLGKKVEDVPPDLLRRLINELNSYQAEEIAINGTRIASTSVIRDINGVTKLDGLRLEGLPMKMAVIARDSDKLYNRIKSSKAMDEFAIDNLKLTVSSPLANVTVPPYEEPVRTKYMEAVKAEKEGI